MQRFTPRTEHGQILHKIMQRHSLTRKDVAEILGVHINTVHYWLAPVTKKQWCSNMRRAYLDLLIRVLRDRASPIPKLCK